MPSCSPCPDSLWEPDANMLEHEDQSVEGDSSGHSDSSVEGEAQPISFTISLDDASPNGVTKLRCSMRWLDLLCDCLPDQSKHHKA